MVMPQRVRAVAEAADAAIKASAAARGNTEQSAPAEKTTQTPAAIAATTAPVVPVPDPLDLRAAPNELEQAKKDLAASEQRFKVLQGKYNAEVPALSEQVRGLTAKVEELASKASQAPAAKLVTADDSSRFGDDMIDMVRRVAGEVVDPLQKKLGAVETSVASTVKTTQRTQAQMYWDEVDALLAAKNITFDAVNDDPAFIDWLAKKDDFSGMTRLSLLEKSQKDMDAQRTALFFTTYADSLPKGDAAASLSDQIQPDLGGGGGDPMNTQRGRIWSGADIKQFYDDKRRGRYKGKEKEAAGIEADILAASREGRTRP